MTASATTVFGNLLTFGLEYLARGLSVFPVCGTLAHTHNGKPCADRGKVPLVQWKKYQDELISQAELRRLFRRFPDANIGMTTGHLSRVLVVDLDGDVAVKLAQARGYGHGPHSFTGRVGGVHRFFGFRPTAPRNFTRTDGIDFRGEGGYVILPPSRHALGRSYTWGEELLDLDDLPELPEWIDDMARLGRVQPAPTTPADEVIYEPGRNQRLTSIGGSMRRYGATEASILSALLTVNARQCRPPLDNDEVRRIARSVASYAPEPDDSPHIRLAAATPGVPAATHWPEPLEAAAFHGPLGAVVRGIEPYSEADPAALLAHAIAVSSAYIGSTLHARAGDMPHPARFFGAVVGETSKARKGTSAAPFRHAMVGADLPVRIASGLSSAEGLVHQIRDKVEKFNSKQGAYEVVDPGVDDKRIVIIESELASLLRRMEREGNAISAMLRDAWDTGNLETLVKNNPTRATNAHINIVAHITIEELREYLHPTEVSSGFANRYLWFAARRSRYLPRGGDTPADVLQSYIEALDRTREWIESLQGKVQIDWDDTAGATWDAGYEELSTGVLGLYGQATQRAEAQVLRLAVLYAALDCSRQIRLAHLHAGLAVWRYCNDSARWVFGDRTGNPTADTIIAALRANGEMTRTQISSTIFQRNVKADRIGAALQLLLKHKLAACTRSGGGPFQGPPTELWRAL